MTGEAYANLTHEDPIDTSGRASLWNGAYETRGIEGVSWFQPEPTLSLELIDALGVAKHEAVIDVGGGASRLVDHLVGDDWQDVTVLDVSAAALDAARGRLLSGAPVTWLCQDLLTWTPTRGYGLWHDRAVLHFLVDPAEQVVYLRALRTALVPGGAVILATFAAGGPQSCSGLPVARYSTDDLATLLGDGFDVVESRQEDHVTPSGVCQPFTWIAARAI